jgi:hypothetical protein
MRPCGCRVCNGACLNQPAEGQHECLDCLTGKHVKPILIVHLTPEQEEIVTQELEQGIEILPDLPED